MERNVQRTVRALSQLERDNPDLFEIRFDLMKNTSSISQIRDATYRPIIATNRRRDQGGSHVGTEESRIGTLLQAARDGFDYIDVELNTKNIASFVRRMQQEGAKVIVSYHNGNMTPRLSALESILQTERRAGANVCKIVTTAKTHADSLRCLSFVNKHARRTKLVCFAMGKLGIPSRVLSPIFGAYFTFASLRVGRETASGQIPVKSLRTVYEKIGIA